MSDLAEAADRASDFLKSLSNPVRLRILCMLVEGEVSVGVLAERMGVRDSLISQHLSLLKKDGLVTPRRSAQTIYYAIADENVKTVIRALHDAFCPVEPDRSQPT